MLITEAYASTTKPEDYQHGEMEKDFKNNPESKVSEVITVQAVEVKTGKQVTAMVSYKYGDDGLPEFSDPTIGECEGPALECRVATIFKHCRDLTLALNGKVA